MIFIHIKTRRDVACNVSTENENMDTTIPNQYCVIRAKVILECSIVP